MRHNRAKFLAHLKKARMYDWMNLLHIAAAIVWLGGAAFMLFAMRPAALALPAPERLSLTAVAMGRFFALVWVCIAILFASGLAMMMVAGMKNAPLGWTVMMAVGLLMFALFGHLYFGPFRRMRLAVNASDWVTAGEKASQVAKLAYLNLLLGALAIAAVLLIE